MKFSFWLSLLSLLYAAGSPPLNIGSKKFTESVLLGEVVKSLLQAHQIPALHRREMGGTRVLWNALLHGDIDVYPEYTGTLQREIFREENITSAKQLDSLLETRGIRRIATLGFNNTYALGMQRQRKAALGLTRISDLVRYPDLRLGFTNEFMERGDGWPGLREAYGLPQRQVQGLDHDLAYRGLVAGSIDVTDLYSTDAEIAYYDLSLLEDDLHYFPEYAAVLLIRETALRRRPELMDIFHSLEGAISDSVMRALNARVKLQGQSESLVAAAFVSQLTGRPVTAGTESRWDRLRKRTLEHLLLVAISLSAAIALALPLGILAARYRRLGQSILSVVGIIQTIPSLALLVFMIPFFGIGSLPAVIALFLYSLLPIVRNTHHGLTTIPLPLREAAASLGFSPWYRLRKIEFPLALQSILAGVKTAAVLNVGTATIGALIGAGGYGQSILTGIRLDNLSLILEGAVPAALMALAVQGLFDLIETRVVSPGLRHPVDTPTT